ncbi:MAG TPA: ATP-binding protein [Dongiaceae bacterium]|nr:ATP-binding protein [Dongiaceae bacterium]
MAAGDALWRGRALRLALGIGALLLFSIVQFGLTGRGSPRAVMLADLCWTAAALFGFQQATVNAWRFHGRNRVVWSGFALACLSWLGSRLYAGHLELVRGEALPFPGWNDAGALAFPLLTIASILAAIRRSDLQASLLRPICNLGLISVALYTSLGLVLHDALTATGAAPFRLLTALAYPVFYGTALLFALIALAVYSEGPRRPTALLLTGALAALAIGATDRGIQMLTGGYLAGGLTDLAWLAGFGLLAWAAWERRQQPRLAPPRPRGESEAVWLEPALPMLSLFAIFAAVAFDTDGLSRDEVMHILVPGGLLFAALLAGAEWVNRTAEVKLRRRAETALRALQVSEERLASILEIAPEAIVAADRDSRIELFNRGAEHVFGYSAAEVIGRPIEILVPDRLRARLAERETRRGGSTASRWAAEFDGRNDAEMVGLRKDGSEFPAEASVFQLATNDELAFAVILRDVTERRRQERDLRNAKETAELANRAKSEFLANMSHELRTPLNAIIGFSQIIESRMYGADLDRYVEYAKDIHNSGADLLKIINDILDLSKIEAGQMNVSEQAIELGRVIDSCLKVVSERAQRGRIALERNLPEHLPKLWADELRVKQMITNLVNNAVKFTEPGGRVVVSVRPSTTATGVEDGIDIVVRDTGIGMDPTEIEVALLPFGQVDQGLARRHEGTGLGLPLTRRMVELHQGRLLLTSARGKGTTVTLHFPKNRVLAPDLAA